MFVILTSTTTTTSPVGCERGAKNRMAIGRKKRKEERKKIVFYFSLTGKRAKGTFYIQLARQGLVWEPRSELSRRFL